MHGLLLSIAAVAVAAGHNRRLVVTFSATVETGTTLLVHCISVRVLEDIGVVIETPTFTNIHVNIVKPVKVLMRDFIFKTVNLHHSL